jgi:serine/threonine protein kinase
MHLGAYEILNPLGEGATARVFRGRDNRGHEVAIKCLELSSASEVSRFEREAALLSELSAVEGILPILATGRTPSGQPYVVTPLLAEGTLANRLEGGPLAVAEAVGIATRLAKALGEAHRRGIVHRDVKPENVLFQDGQALLADLGLAKHLTDRADNASLTQTGELRGSLPYIAPEQANDAKRAGPPADVYALGTLLFECLTGTTPFDLGSPGSTGDLLRELRPEAPRALTNVVVRCLRHDPKERYPDGTALEVALSGGSSRGPRFALGALALLLGGLGAGALLNGGWGSEDPGTPSPSASTSKPSPAPTRPLAARATELSNQSPLPWRALSDLLTPAIGRDEHRQTLLDCAKLLERDAFARAARGGPLDPSVDEELVAAIRLLDLEPSVARRLSLRRARWLRQRGWSAEALAALEGLRRDGPLGLEVRLLEAKLLRKTAGRDETRALLVKLSQEDEGGRIGRLARATWLAIDWRYPESSKIAADLKAENPKDAEALHLLSVAHAWKGNPEKALSFLESERETWPDSALIARVRGKALSRLKRSEEALAAYGAAITLKQPKLNLGALCDRGRYLTRLGRYAEARADFDAGVAADDVDALLFRGLLSWVEKDRARARADWKAAHQRSPQWYVRRMPDLPWRLWRELSETAGIPLPRGLHRRLREAEKKR